MGKMKINDQSSSTVALAAVQRMHTVERLRERRRQEKLKEKSQYDQSTAESNRAREKYKHCIREKREKLVEEHADLNLLQVSSVTPPLPPPFPPPLMFSNF